jgi:hypothetical protein
MSSARVKAGLEFRTCLQVGKVQDSELRIDWLLSELFFDDGIMNYLMLCLR